MLTGELRSKIDKVWEQLWTGGLSNHITVIEQMTYMLFIRRLDDIHTQLDQNHVFLKKTIDYPIYFNEVFVSNNNNLIKKSKMKQLRIFFFICLVILSTRSHSQINSFKMMYWSTENEIKQSVSEYISIKETYSEGGKTLLYEFADFDVIYGIKANRKVNKIWISFKSSSKALQMNQWFYDNNFSARMSPQTGEYEWKKTLKVRGADNKLEETVVTCIRLDDNTYFFTNKVNALLGF
jgi:hypothetical protein